TAAAALTGPHVRSPANLRQSRRPDRSVQQEGRCRHRGDPLRPGSRVGQPDRARLRRHRRGRVRGHHHHEHAGRDRDRRPAGRRARAPDGVTDLFSKFDDVIALRQGLLDSGRTDPFNLVMERVESPTVAICNGKRTILLGTYNYMGMTFDPDVIAAGKQALDDFGSGTTGSRVLNGTYAGHKAVEAALCEFYAMDHAMVFSTGYQANLGIISTIAGKGDYIVLDIDSHASIWDGCKMGDAEVVPFKHNDLDAMERRLRRIPEGAGKLVVLEGVYSMLGDIAPLKEMIKVAKDNGAMVLVDEAHSMGFIGPNGRGVAEDQGVLDDVDFVIGTFSKSVGTVGGFCVS